MKILQNNNDRTILLNSETNFGTDLGWEDNFQEFEHETLKEIINPTENFETVRYTHAEYTGGEGLTQHDLWLEFYFVTASGYHTPGGLNYEFTGLLPEDNAKLLKSEETSFFRLEFYKILSGETEPTSINRKLFFTKNYPVPMSESVYYTPIRDQIYVPIFIGSNYRKTENMYLYWFQDTTALDGTAYNDDVFYVSAKYFNAINGKSITFINKDKHVSEPIDESKDIYHKMVIDRSNYSYTMYSGVTTTKRIGTSTGTTPMKWYAAGTSSSAVYPSPTPSVSVTRTPTPTPSTSPPIASVTPTPTSTPGAPTPTPSSGSRTQYYRSPTSALTGDLACDYSISPSLSLYLAGSLMVGSVFYTHPTHNSPYYGQNAFWRIEPTSGGGFGLSAKINNSGVIQLISICHDFGPPAPV